MKLFHTLKMHSSFMFGGELWVKISTREAMNSQGNMRRFADAESVSLVAA